MTHPAGLETILSAPGFGDVYANNEEGELLRRKEQSWVVVPAPEDLPPIVALLGFVHESPGMELVVGVDTGSQSALWTLLMGAGSVEHAWPTATDVPEYGDSVQFLRTHHTPWCRDGDRHCLAWTKVDDHTYIDMSAHRYAQSRTPLLKLSGDMVVADVAWADERGDAVYLAAQGTPCVVAG